MKLKLTIRRSYNCVAVQILEQEGEFKQSKHIRIQNAIDIYPGEFYLRGNNKTFDWKTVSIAFNTIDEAIEYHEKLIDWLNDFMESQWSWGYNEDIKVRNGDGPWFHAQFLAYVLEEPRPFIVRYNGNLDQFQHGSKVAYGKAKDTHTWEIED